MSSEDTRVKDLYLAAYLYSNDKKLLRVEREGKVCWFIFQQCNDLVDQYWADVAIGKIKTYTDSIRTLKDLIYSQQ